ncbi:MAG: ribosome biogenesis GTPase Der [Planctomycetes bacterium]|nr:ribosome biogenesis GTPase Der [Planctomycetota bacterium]
MSLPVVAIVGRPNVGKSSLLNALARKRISIVEATAGVTRDRISAIIEYEERFFELVDTGGYGIDDADQLSKLIVGQINMAIERAELVLFVVDIREGVLPLDREVAELLRRPDLKVILVANKADTLKLDSHGAEFCVLGFGEPLSVSAQHGRNRTELLDQILVQLAGMDQVRPEQTQMMLAVVGKQNTGKSTFINCLAGEQRVIVSEVPGTTRESVDVRFERDGKTFVAIDTAGLRKKKKMASENISFYSYSRALRSVRRSHIVLLFIDSTVPISQVDKKLARTICDEFKACILVVNKWDLAKDAATTDQYREYLDKVLPGLGYAPICFITASDGKNVHSLLDLSMGVYKQITTTVSTGRLNKAMGVILSERAPSIKGKSRLPKIFYATQVANCPPTILLFVNNPAKFDENYMRYLVNRLRQLLPFADVPIRLFLRHHHTQRQKPA